MVSRVTPDEVGITSISSVPTPVPRSKDEGPQPVVNPVSTPPITGADSLSSYDPSNATTPALIPDCGTYDDVSATTVTEGIDPSTQHLPLIIAPALLQPALQDFSPTKRNENQIVAGVCVSHGRYSAAAKGKGRAPPEQHPSSANVPKPLFPDVTTEELHRAHTLYSPANFSSTEKWTAHTRPILQDYANRQINLPLGKRVNVSLNEPSQFIQGALQLLANRDIPHTTPVEPSRQLGPQLLENFTDVHRWASEYFRARFGMSTAGTDVPVLLTIITNTFYEAHTQLIDSIVSTALGNMRTRGAAALGIEDFAFGYDFKMSHDLPFAVESSSRIHNTLEQHRLRSSLNIPVKFPVTTQSGRQIKLSKQAQAAAQAESDKQIKSFQRKKEKEKKKQESVTIPRLRTPQATSDEAKKKASTPHPSAVGVVGLTPSAAVHHTSKQGSLIAVEADVVVPASEKCPTRGRVMAPRTPTSQAANTVSVQSQPTASQNASSLQRVTTSRSSVTSNLGLVPLTMQLSPAATSDIYAHVNSEATPSATAMPGRTFSAQIPAGNVAPMLTTGTATYPDLAQGQATSVRGGRRTVRAGGRGRGARSQGGRGSAPLTITIPARPLPAAPASTSGPTESASTETIARTDTVGLEPSVDRKHLLGSQPLGLSSGSITSTHRTDPVPPTTAPTEVPVRARMARAEPVNTTGGLGHAARIAASASTNYSRHYPTTTGNLNSTSASAYYPQYYSTQTTTRNTVANTSHPHGTISREAMISAANAYYPDHQSSTTNNAENTAASIGSTRGRATDFTDPEQWIADMLPVGDSRGVGAEVPVTRNGNGHGNIPSPKPAIAANEGGTFASSSHVEIRQSKKRKLDASE